MPQPASVAETVAVAGFRADPTVLMDAQKGS